MDGKKLRLKPSARDKRRYFIADAENSKIEEAILENLGTMGFAKVSYKKVSVKGLNGQTVGSCLVKGLNDVRAALTSKGIKITKVSGTLKGLGMS